MNPTPQDRARERLQRLSYWLDSGLRVPGTRFRFGLESLIGLIPGVGDFAGLLLSGWLIVEARRAGAPGHLQLRMLGNALVDAGLGAVPVAGDIFDLLFRANTRNAELLRQHLGLPAVSSEAKPDLKPDPKPDDRKMKILGVVCVLTALIFLGVWVLRR